MMRILWVLMPALLWYVFEGRMSAYLAIIIWAAVTSIVDVVMERGE